MYNKDKQTIKRMTVQSAFPKKLCLNLFSQLLKKGLITFVCFCRTDYFPGSGITVYLLCLSQHKKRAPKEHREMTRMKCLCENKEK